MWRWGAGLGAVAVAAVIAVLLLGGESGADGPSFRLAPAERGPVSAEVSATGTLGAVVTVQVGSQVSGQIAELLADYNTEVRAGQIVARIDPATFEARVRQTTAELAVARAGVVTATAAVARARAELQDVRTGLADAARDLERKRDLLRNGNVARAVVDSAEALHAQSVARVAAREAALQSAEAELVTARAQVERAEAALHANQVDLDRSVIRSPIDGVVVARNVDLGQTVAASLQAPVLFSIAQDLREMQVEVSVDEADIGRVLAGQRAIFTVDAFTGREFSGLVEQVRLQPRIVQNVVTYTVVVTAANDDLRLLPGMTANVRIVHDERTATLRVPNAALRWRPAGAAPGVAANATGQGAPAGPGGQTPPDPEVIIARLTQSLALDAGQVEQVRAAFVAMRAQVGALRQQGMPPAEMGPRVQELRSGVQRQIASLLDPAQRQKYQAIIAGRAAATTRPGTVFVVGDDGAPREVAVTAGLADGSNTEIVAGPLAAGDRVIVGEQAAGAAPTPRMRLGF